MTEKKKTKHKRRSKPRSFTTTLRTLSAYQSVKLSEEKALQWLEVVFADLQSPNGHLAQSFHKLVGVQESVTKELGNENGQT